MDENHYDKTGSKLSTSEYRDTMRHIHKKSWKERTGFAGKTLWDFIQLLLIPLVLSGVGIGFTWYQSLTSARIAKEQRQETTLQTYLDDMTKLFSTMHLASPEPNDALAKEAAVIARAKTLTVLRQLNPAQNGLPDQNGLRKGLVIQFLSEAGLVTSNKDGRPPIITLDTADLRGADLTVANLGGADLHGAHLDGAHLEGANLSAANLSGADLSRANLRGTNLSVARLIEAKFPQADLSGADLHGAHLEGAHLEGANHLEGAHLEGADLRGANLSGATLDKTTILKGARYNTKEIQVKDLPVPLPPTRWPQVQGFDYKAAGATEDNTVP